MLKLSPLAMLLMLFLGCSKKDDTGPLLLFKIKLSSTQARLDDLGNPTQIAPGHAAQTPTMNAISLNYLELLPDARTQLGNGVILYKGHETSAGGAGAIDFSQAQINKEGDVFLSVPAKNIPSGTYPYLRVSVTYVNFNVVFNLLNVPNAGILPGQNGVFGGFSGYETYISTFKVKDTVETITANKTQGYWAFETELPSAYGSYNRMVTGQCADGGITMVNPIYLTSPIPKGSDVITGTFDTPLSIPGSIGSDMTLTLSFSTNNCFEWQDLRANGQWDIDVRGQTVEPVVDFGFRGLQVITGK